MEYPSLNTAKAGAIRFNTDSSQLEIYDGNQWTGILATSPHLHTGGTRGVFAGGSRPAPATRNVMDFGNLDTTGNFVDFGDCTVRSQLGGTASRVRGLVIGGWTGSQTINTIEFITIASKGDAVDFGDRTVSSTGNGSCSDGTRGVTFGQFTPTVGDVIDYVTIASTGDSEDFGNLTVAKRIVGACQSPTRGIAMGG